MKIKPVQITLCALFAALSAILSQIAIPIGPVPVNFTHVSIFLAAGLLGKKYGTISQATFVLLGLVGVPVFSNFRGGASMLAGPTGGFILGYIACTFVTALLIERFGTSMKVSVPAMYAGWCATYVMGVPWFMYVTNTTDIVTALTVCVLPFLFGDFLKTIISAILIKRIKPALNIKM